MTNLLSVDEGLFPRISIYRVNTQIATKHVWVFALFNRVMISVSKGKLEHSSLADLFHDLLFAYQKVLGGIGLENFPGSLTGEAIPIIKALIEQKFPSLASAGLRLYFEG